MIRFDKVALRRGTRLLLSDTSFTIHARYKVGLTGPNGAGKSSLLGLLTGQLHPETGLVALDQGLVIAHVAQEIPGGAGTAADFVIDGDREFRELESRLAQVDASRDPESFGAAQSRFETIDGYGAPARARKLLSGLGFTPEQQAARVDHLSGGWRVRLGLARALMCRSDILLLDEPTNHLDLDAVLWLQQWLANYRGVLILISHDREFLDGVVDHILNIANGGAVLYTGNYSDYEVRRAEQLAQIQSERVKQQREIARIHNFIDRFRAKATKAKQVQSRMKVLSRMDVIAQAHVDSPLEFCFRVPEKMPCPLVTLEQVGLSYGERAVLEGVDVSIRPGDRIGLLGPNGAGKTSLIKLLAGNVAPTRGYRAQSADTALGYFAQHSLEQLSPTESALEHLAAVDRRATERELRSFLGSFAFSGERALDPVMSFSGGERARLALALLVYRRPNLLLLDEPTNHLDMDMRFSVARALQDYSGAILLVSHDRFLLRSVVDEFWLVQGKRVERFPGDLEDYRQRLDSVDGDPLSVTNLPSPREKRRAQAEIRSRLSPLEKAVRHAEAQLEQLTADLRKLEQCLADPELYSRPGAGDLKALTAEKSLKDRILRELEDEWLAASDALESARQEIDL
jgi:ATP-binding cassette, subfamily F, member 3